MNERSRLVPSASAAAAGAPSPAGDLPGSPRSAPASGWEIARDGCSGTWGHRFAGQDGTSYPSAPLRPARGAAAAMRSVTLASDRPRAYVTRRLPGDALERLAAAAEVEVWPGRLPPPPEE